MSYIVYARKYRPQEFDEIVGQKFVATTLKNAIQGNRIAHAYLFAGPRGIGKTSTARIFAKSLNCAEGPTVRPCQKCTSCTEISIGSSLDVLEIDGASNRGIDEIRNLRENVKFGAIHGKFKIYIIDEVHMLTQEAFNALLKTLEEPPLHTKFVFATTQPHKVPATIISRCQRFDFRRISNNEIISKMGEIVKKEKLNISEDALFEIAKAAGGSMRDAETILDQLGSFCKDKIKREDVSEALGIIEEDKIFSVFEYISNKDAATALLLVDKLVNEGKDPTQFTSDLIGHARNLLVAKAGKNPETLIDLPAQSIEKITVQSDQFQIHELLYIVYFLMNTMDSMRRFASARILLEAALIKIASRDSVLSLNQILDKISGVEKNPRPKTHDPKPITHDSRPTTQDLPFDSAQGRQPTAVDIEEQKIDKIWMSLLKIVRDKKMSVASYLLEGTVHSIDDSVFTIGFPKNLLFHKESLERVENRSLIENSLKDILKKDVRVRFTTLDHVKEFKPPASEDSPDEQPQEEITEPIIQSAIQVFKGKVVGERKGQRRPR